MTPWLYAHPNPHATLRTNGIRFHGYPKRRSAVRIIVIHTAESTPDYTDEDGGAEAVARYLDSVDRPASYHEIGDSDSFVTMLPPEAVAFGARGANADAWHWSFATKAHLWPMKPDWWIDQALAIGAKRVAKAVIEFGVPIERITLMQREHGAKGIMAHGDIDPTRRHDPGGAFPWERFLDLVAREVEGDDVDPKTQQDLEDTARNTARQVRLTEALVESEVAQYRAGLGLKPDPESDRLWSGWIRDGDRTFEDAQRELREKAKDG